MFEVWYILKFDYTSATAAEPQSRTIGYEHLDEAKRIFFQLELSYQIDAPVRIKGDKMIKVTRAWLYESFKFKYEDAVGDIASGEATLMYEAQGIAIDV